MTKSRDPGESIRDRGSPGGPKEGGRSVRRWAVSAAMPLIIGACSGGGGGETTAAPTETTDGGSTETTAAPSGDQLSVNFIFPNEGNPEIIFYAFFVAEDLGFFAEENLVATPIGSDGSSAATQQMVAGQADAGTPFSAAVLEAFTLGLDTRYLYTYSTAQNFGIVVLDDSPIQSVADLAGKTIGISEEDGGEVPVIRAALQNVGLDPDNDVTLLAIGEGGPATLAAIENGEVDAYSSSTGDQLTLRARGLVLRDITPPEFDAFPAHGISTTVDALENNRAGLVALARGYAKATLFCQTSPEACETIMKRLSPIEWEEEELGDLNLQRLIDITAVPEGSLIGEHRREAWDAFNQFRVDTDEEAILADLDTFLVSDLTEEFNDFDHQALIDMANGYSE